MQARNFPFENSGTATNNKRSNTAPKFKARQCISRLVHPLPRNNSSQLKEIQITAKILHAVYYDYFTGNTSKHKGLNWWNQPLSAYYLLSAAFFRHKPAWRVPEPIANTSQPLFRSPCLAVMHRSWHHWLHGTHTPHPFIPAVPLHKPSRSAWLGKQVMMLALITTTPQMELAIPSKK